MIGPKLPEGWVSPGKRRHRELQALRKMADTKATLWHHQFMAHALGGRLTDSGPAQYAKGMADAYSEVFHALSVMLGYPWA